ncbi:unnamed protein product [Caenorhabditis auriculariae]|uniref:Major facilitator superfamily (MFS) profile domain-containing protein n=1 Tax=Caenorhabditis auriculariae TaxID=2777116 RepID=A0A8S1H8B2_9PELO|nr:unnamed protein product [Caenorhabditis auriculariae]
MAVQGACTNRARSRIIDRELEFLIFVYISFAANFNYGFSTTYLNTPVQQFKIYINESLARRDTVMNDSTYNLIWNILLNIWFVGFFVGIGLSPVLNDRYGRKVGFLAGNFLAFLASVLRCAAIYWYIPELLITARLITSVCVAVTYQSCILYLQECSPTELRGFMSFWSEISFAIMTLIASLLGTDGVLGGHLFWLLAFAVPFCFIFFITLFFILETPKFLLITAKNEEAAENSVHFYLGSHVDAKEVLRNIQMEEDAEESDISTIQALKDLFFEPHLRRAHLLSCATLQNTVPLWSILLSSTYFLEQANLQSSIAQWSSTAMTLAYVLGTLSGSTVIEKWGRRPLLLIFTLLNILAVATFVLFSQLQPVLDQMKYGCLGALVVYGFTYGTAVGPISWFISSELVPQKYRSITQSTSYAINTIMVVVSTFTILPLYSVLGSFAFLPLYTVPSAFALFYLYRFLPETKGREIYEIVRELRGD